MLVSLLRLWASWDIRVYECQGHDLPGPLGFMNDTKVKAVRKIQEVLRTGWCSASQASVHSHLDCSSWQPCSDFRGQRCLACVGGASFVPLWRYKQLSSYHKKLLTLLGRLVSNRALSFMEVACGVEPMVCWILGMVNSPGILLGWTDWLPGGKFWTF